MSLYADKGMLAAEMDKRVTGESFKVLGSESHDYKVIGVVVAEEKDGKRTGQLAARVDGRWS